MKPVDFKESNYTFTAPADDPSVGDLHVHRSEGFLISCWELSWQDRLSALFFGRLWLHIRARKHPVVGLRMGRKGFS